MTKELEALIEKNDAAGIEELFLAFTGQLLKVTNRPLISRAMGKRAHLVFIAHFWEKSSELVPDLKVLE